MVTTATAKLRAEPRTPRVAPKPKELPPCGSRSSGSRAYPRPPARTIITITPSPEEKQAIELLWQSLPDGFRQESRELILRAYLVASYAHRNAQRESGEPYITHPIAVAQILTELRMDPEALAAGLLHDVAEDTEFSIDYLRVQFGPTIAKLVDGVTKLKSIQEKKSKVDHPAEQSARRIAAQDDAGEHRRSARSDHQAGRPPP